MKRPILADRRSLALGALAATVLGFGVWRATRPERTPAFDGPEIGAAIDRAGRDGADSASEGSKPTAVPPSPVLPSAHGRRLARNEPVQKVLVEGRVVQERTGEPIAGARITVLSRTPTSIGGTRSIHDAARPPSLDAARVVEVTSANDGTFAWRGPLTRPTEGEYYFGARAAGYGARIGPFPAVDDAHPIAVIELRPEAAVRGRVVGGDGKPVAGMCVDVRLGFGREEDAWWRKAKSLNAVTDSSGYYELREIDVSGGAWKTAVEFGVGVRGVRWYGGGSLTGAVPLCFAETIPATLRAGVTATVDWIAEGGVDADESRPLPASITGHVRDAAGRPIADARIEVDAARSLHQFAPSRGGALPEGKGAASIAASGHAVVVETATNADADGAFEIHQFRFGAIEPGQRLPQFNAPSIRIGAPKPLALTASAMGYVASTRVVNTGESGPIEFVLESATTQEGMVTEADGTAVVEARVEFWTGKGPLMNLDEWNARAKEPRPERVEIVLTDREGRFRAIALPDAPVTVVVYSQGQQFGELPRRVFRETPRQPMLRLVLEPRATKAASDR